MKLLFLGTGAADWNIKKRPDTGEWRRFSSALIDGTLLVDPGPHIFDYAERSGNTCLFDGVRNIIVTHSHPDHLCPQVLSRLCSGGRGCRVFGDAACLRVLRRRLGSDMAIDFVCVTPYDSFVAGGYRIIPMLSNHSTGEVGERTLNYVISDGDKSMFYGLDTGWLPTSTWRRMREIRFDCMVLELTMGNITPGDDRIFSHTSIPMLKIMLETFRAQGCAPEGCRIVVSHLARALHNSHEDTEAALAPLGVDVAYDGMKYEF